MENNNLNNQWPPYNNQGQNQPKMYNNVPNSMGSFVIGIIAICVPIVCCICYGLGPLAGIALGIIGYFLGNSATRQYEANPQGYSEASYKKARTGKLLSVIGLLISLAIIAAVIVFVYLGVTHQLPPYWQRGFDSEGGRNFDFD